MWVYVVTQFGFILFICIVWLVEVGKVPWAILNVTTMFCPQNIGGGSWGIDLVLCQIVCVCWWGHCFFWCLVIPRLWYAMGVVVFKQRVVNVIWGLVIQKCSI